MTGTDRLLQAAQDLQKLKAQAQNDLEREAIEATARELADQAEAYRCTLTGLTLPMIRQGLVTP